MGSVLDGLEHRAPGLWGAWLYPKPRGGDSSQPLLGFKKAVGLDSPTVQHSLDGRPRGRGDAVGLYWKPPGTLNLCSTGEGAAQRQRQGVQQSLGRRSLVPRFVPEPESRWLRLL